MTPGARSTIRVLITGFGPFPGIECNASAAVAHALEQSAALLPGIELFAAVIPVEWAQARAAAHEAIAKANPHAILHLGVSKRATGFRIETRALNAARPKPDHAGAARPPGQLARGGAPVLPATLPPARLLSALRRAGLPAQLSRSAGHYLCNALYYWSLADARAGGPLAGFVHMPAIGIEAAARSCLTLEDAIAGAKVLVRAAARAVLCARQNGSACNGERGRHGSQGFHGAWRSGGTPGCRRG
jgi:pyroglutamyl-peptidase